MNTRFEVSAEWMKACGFGDAAKVFDVLSTQEFRGVNPDFGTMLTLDDGTPAGWTVAICRGRIVPLPTREQIDAAVDNATHAAFEALVAANIPMPADHLTALYSLSNYLEQFVREALDA